MTTQISTASDQDVSSPDIPPARLEPLENESPAEAEEQEAPILDRQGPAFDRRHPFFLGLTGALGVIAAYLGFRVVVGIADVVLLVGLALFLAVGFDPIITRLSRSTPRVIATVIVAGVITAALALFIGLALTTVAHEASQLTRYWPKYRQQIINGQGWLGQLAVRTHLNTYVRGNTSASSKGGPGTPFNVGLIGGVLGAGKLLLSAISSLIVVLILTLYFMVTLPAVRTLWLRFIPASRRPRVAAFTDEAFLRVGGFVLGNILTSVVAGAGTAAWAAIFHIPYPFLLGGLVALLDLIPVIGSTVGGAVVALVALTQGLPIAIATAAFYIVYRFLEDHLLNPVVMRRTVHISAGVSIVATLVGAALLGILGALVAIPVTATIQLVLEKVTFPSLEKI